VNVPGRAEAARRESAQVHLDMNIAQIEKLSFLLGN
jgi:hypothetical protein